MEDALKECARTPLWARSPKELVEGLDRVQVLARQLASLGLELLREIDGRGIPTAQGASSTTAWLRERYRLSPGAASQQVRLAAALACQLPETEAALAGGSITVEQADLIAKAIPDLPAQYRAEGERFLVARCAQFGPRELGRLTERVLDHIAPEVAERRAAAQLARGEQRAYDDRGLHLTEVHGSARIRVSGWLDRESAAVVRSAIDPLCAPRPGDGEPHPRSPGQRRRDRRLFTGPTRRALVLRDRGCAFPGCDRPPRWCDGHHVISWLDGGPTGLGNGVLLCGHHHRVIHQGRWQVGIAADGLPEFIPPEYIDPERQPRRNTYHQRE